MFMKGDLVLVWSYGQNRDGCAIYMGEAEPTPERFPRYWVYSPELLARDLKSLHITARPRANAMLKVRQIKRVVQTIQEAV